MLTFIQLADIHFRERDDRTQRNLLNYQQRDQLKDDILYIVDELGGKVSGILICGDIANAGTTVQFNQAISWLREVCTEIKLDPWMIWMVPGNHDVDWDLVGPEHEALR